MKNSDRPRATSSRIRRSQLAKGPGRGREPTYSKSSKLKFGTTYYNINRHMRQEWGVS